MCKSDMSSAGIAEYFVGLLGSEIGVDIDLSIDVDN